jgi:predicted metal-dependent peptidase
MGGGTYKLGNEEITEEGLSNYEICGVITHEFDHFVYGHITVRRHDNVDVITDNIAKDLAINWLIQQRWRQPRDLLPGEVARPLPKIALIPGQRPYVDPTKFNRFTPERKKAIEHFLDLIEKLPGGKASEWYLNKLLEDKEKNPDKYPQPLELELLFKFDEHSEWDEIPIDEIEYVQGKAKAIIEKAVRHADSQPDGWGTIPMEMREEIRRSISTIIDWRAVLRQFVGSIVRSNRTTTMKRINKRYPYIHPGTKRGHTAKLIIAIDESGSVSDEMLNMFFAELESLTRKVDVSILHFDCVATAKDLHEWRRGMRPELYRVRGGGTNFNAPTDFVNDPKNRGRWDGLLIMTDGCAPAPGPSRIKRGWILGQGCKLDFQTEETQIFLSKDTHARRA